MCVWKWERGLRCGGGEWVLRVWSGEVLSEEGRTGGLVSWWNRSIEKGEERMRVDFIVERRGYVRRDGGEL